jgi:hypothetical protein
MCLSLAWWQFSVWETSAVDCSDGWDSTAQLSCFSCKWLWRASQARVSSSHSVTMTRSSLHTWWVYVPLYSGLGTRGNTVRHSDYTGWNEIDAQAFHPLLKEQIYIYIYIYICRLYTTYNLNYTPTILGVQSWRQIISGGMGTKKVEYHWSRKCESLDVSQPYGPVIGIALPFANKLHSSMQKKPRVYYLPVTKQRT